MRIQALAALVAGATLAQVGASPIRVIVVTGSQELKSPQRLRFGHGAADSPVAKMSSLPHPTGFGFIHPQSTGHLPCGKLIKDKAIGLSNAFRQALGLPVIEAATLKAGDRVHGGMIHIMPFVGTPPMFTESTKFEAGGRHPLVIKMQEGQIHRHPHHQFHHHHHKFHQWSNNFSMRIHNALMALGPWEGRAVAFVLGCGIGVLLRMFWVLAVVTYRSIRGGGERENEYTQVAAVEEYFDAEEIVVPPPSYTTLNEKDQVKVKDGGEN